MAVSPITGVPLPAAGSTDQVPADLMTAFTAAEKMFVGQFASAANRDAKITTPVKGMTAWLDSPGDFYEYVTGNVWRRRGYPVSYSIGGWPANAPGVAGTGNIGTTLLTVNPGLPSYTATITVGGKFTYTGTGQAELQIVVAGTVKARNQLVMNISGTWAGGTVSRNIDVRDGSSLSVQGNLVVPAGLTVTSYVDDSHSFVQALVVPT